MATRTNVVHGARALVKYNGKNLARIQNIEIVERTPLGSVDPIGQHAAAEHIRLSYEVDVSFTMYRAPLDSLKALGLFPNTGTPREIFELEGAQIEVYDQLDDIVIERLTEVQLEECSRGYSKGQLTTYQCRGKAIMATDEAQT